MKKIHKAVYKFAVGENKIRQFEADTLRQYCVVRADSRGLTVQEKGGR